MPNLTLLTARIEHWPIAGAFTISRGAKTEAVTVVAEIRRGDVTGRGECVPYARYGETPEATLAAILAMQDRFGAGLDRLAMQTVMPAGAARNALDCALLDLEAKTAGGGFGTCWAGTNRTPAPPPIRFRSAPRRDGGGDRQSGVSPAAQDQARQRR